MNAPTDIRTWLENLGLGDLAPVFEQHHITTELLSTLTVPDLNEMGVTSLGHRKILIAAIAAMNAPESHEARSEAPVSLPPEVLPDTAPAAVAKRIPPVLEPPTVKLKLAQAMTPLPQVPRTVAPLVKRKAGRKVVNFAWGSAKDSLPADIPPPPVAPPPLSEPTGRRKVFSGRFMAISIGIHLVLAIGAGFWVVQNIEVKRKLQFSNGPPTVNPSSRALEHKLTLQKKKNAGGSPAQARRISVTGLASKVTLPDMPSVPTSSTQFVAGRMAGMGGAGFGTGLGFGNGSGMGVGGNGGGTGRLFAMMPQAMGKRCSKADRLQRLKENGGTPACEEAVVKGLRWLKTSQNGDGSWGNEHQTAMTGLALMAYFGHCETPLSPEFGETVVKGIAYLVSDGMQGGGKLGGDPAGQPFCYEHAIGTYALAEATTFCREIKFSVPNLVETTTKAGQFIINNQHSNGGWAYKYETSTGAHVDVSVVGWQIQALKACSHTGIEFANMGDCITKGLDYLATCQNELGAFGYMGPPPLGSAYQPLTGVGMLCFQMWGQGKGAIARKAAKYTLDTTKFDFKSDANLYAHYYESQAMIQRSSTEWKRYNDLFRDQLLSNQGADGSWGVPPGSPHVKDTLFSTCLCTLMMEVYYRFLSTGGGIGGGRGRLGY